MALLNQPDPFQPSPSGSGSGFLNSALNVLDPSGVRLSIAKLFKGGASTEAALGTLGKNISFSGTTAIANDWRVRISLPDANSLFYKEAGSIQTILQRTNGVIFPYTPTITVAHNARYQEQALTHSNYKNYFYEGSDVAPITISGDFTVQNLDEGQYLLAAIYFFRSCTKMFVGNDALAGNPPPIVYLDGYGDFYFPHVSCVVTSFSHTMPAEVDYVEIPYSPGLKLFENNGVAAALSKQSVRLPTTSTLSVTVQPVYSRKNTHDNFTLTDFSKGKLLKGKGGFL
jgi:hypothetical protein